MIRREIIATAAVAAACFAAGEYGGSRTHRAEVPAPSVVPELAAPTEVAVAPPEVDLVAPAEIPPPLWLGWPNRQPENPTLTWPPSGCDAGMWNITYKPAIRDGIVDIAFTMDSGKPGTLRIGHLPGWRFALHPVSPQSLWSVEYHPRSTGFMVQRVDRDGQQICAATDVLGASGEGEVRAEADEKGIRVYRRTARTWSVFQYDNACDEVARRVVPGSLADPMGDRSWGLNTVGHSVRNNVLVIEPALRPHTTLTADGPIRKAIIGSGVNGTPVAYWDDHAIYLHVLGAGFGSIWSLKLDNQQPWQDAVTAIEFADHYVSVRGGLDGAPWNAGNEWIRVYDIESGEVVGGREVERGREPCLQGLGGLCSDALGGPGRLSASRGLGDLRPCFYTNSGCFAEDGL